MADDETCLISKLFVRLAEFCERHLFLVALLGFLAGYGSIILFAAWVHGRPLP